MRVTSSLKEAGIKRIIVKVAKGTIKLWTS